MEKLYNKIENLSHLFLTKFEKIKAAKFCEFTKYYFQKKVCMVI
jgi:hypothetical protein